MHNLWDQVSSCLKSRDNLQKSKRDKRKVIANPDKHSSSQQDTQIPPPQAHDKAEKHQALGVTTRVGMP